MRQLVGLNIVVFILGGLLFTGSLAHSQSDSKAPNLPVLALAFDTSTTTLSITIKNVSTSSLSVYDEITTGDMPHFVWARLLDKDGHIMGEESYYPTRYFNGHMLKSTNEDMPTPVKMRTIKPGRSIIGHIPLNRILAGLDGELTPEMRKGGDFCVQFKVTVYSDPYLEMSRSVEKESAVACTRGYKAL
jgi:hypothetical protein